MKLKRQHVIWLGGGLAALLVLLAGGFFLSQRTFNPRQVTGVIVGFETNDGVVSALISVTNNSPRAIYRESYGPVSVFFDGTGDGTMVVSDSVFTIDGPVNRLPELKIPVGKACKLKVPMEPHGKMTEIQMTFETEPRTSEAPAWIRKFVPDRFKKPQSFEVTAEPKGISAK